MKNLKVSNKLLVGFLIIVALAMVIGAIGIFSTTSVNSDYVYLVHGPLERQNLLKQMKSDFTMMRYRVANFIMNSGDKEFISNTLQPQYLTAYNSFVESLANYQISNNNDTRREESIRKDNAAKAVLLGELVARYNEVSNKARGMSLANDPETADSLLKESIPIANEINT